MQAVIFANGECPAAGTWPPAAADCLVIAVDGGLRQALARGYRPDLVVGDFDSLSEAELAALTAAGTPCLRYPVEKDATDLELALRQAVARGVDAAVVYCALGGRWDQTLANVLLAFAPGLASLRLSLVDGPTTLWPLAGPGALALDGRQGDRVSLLPLGDDCQGVVTVGLAYPLADETLVFGATRGVSNVLLGGTGQVRLAAGRLLVIHERQGPAPATPHEEP